MVRLPSECFPESRPRFGILLSIALLAILMNIAAISYQYVRISSVGKEREYSYIGDDHPVMLPVHFGAPVALTYLEQREHYLLFNNPAANAEWSALIPPGDAYVYLGPEKRRFAVTLFHQLHCLYILRSGIIDKQGRSVVHYQHCLSYLRQTILCAADVTLETRIGEVPIHYGIPRNAAENATHICRDWRKIYSFMDELYWDES